MTAPGATSDPSSMSRPRGESWTRRGRCRRCSEDVLLVDGEVLDVAEIVPRYPCGQCRGTGHVGPRRGRNECPRCYGTRYLGIEVPPDEVFFGLSPHGNLRETRLAERLRGEALHREHICGTRH
jgi:ribosomal protein S27AE